MIFPNGIFLRITIFVLGISGFMVARHIRSHKTKNTPLICPARFDCQAVVHSDYSKFLGIPVELFGMIYYAFITIAYFFLIFLKSEMPFSLGNILMGISFMAFLFSTYLLTVQIFILKKGCSWCMASTIISALIFILLLV